MDTITGHYDINVRAVTGNGASHLKEVMATMDAPSLSQPAFTRIESQIGASWECISQDELLAAGAEERRLAIEDNCFHQGVPAITVVADGGWSKRTHKHSYNALACPRYRKIPGIREPGVWFEDKTKPSVSKRTVTCRKKTTSRPKSTSTVTQKISTVPSDRNTASVITFIVKERTICASCATTTTTRW
ncbi:hypothetical protein DPMN_187272 [Dreissena polymorpha]|uniref:Mutator-like transposase domain-containing protein n=1 Tax=Dreissena polymorpha TaxID=45954 RepID=A0A9D4I7C6_DREPO|nr:hypothetical protein DPMN_187272 [Dreissena polymorpha]